MNLNPTSTSVQTLKDLPVSWKVFPMTKTTTTTTTKRQVAMIFISGQYRNQANFQFLCLKSEREWAEK